jgi:hypothetical protein
MNPRSFADPTIVLHNSDERITSIAGVWCGHERRPDRSHHPYANDKCKVKVQTRIANANQGKEQGEATQRANAIAPPWRDLAISEPHRARPRRAVAEQTHKTIGYCDGVSVGAGPDVCTVHSGQCRKCY